ncbi:MAG: GAF domain-containing protein [Herpetosiphonaceae bacterium]|nr:GAF domain-containing protein [Herpetosiphonaceae bacterium]
MTQELLHPLLTGFPPEDRELVSELLADPQAPSWRAHCFSLGYQWFNQEHPADELTRFGFGLASILQRDQADIVTELLLGFATAREDRHSHEWSERWQKRVAELDGLHRIVSAANSTVSLDASLLTVVETVAEVMGSDVCSIFLFDRDRSLLLLRATHGLNPGAIGEVSIRLGQGITGLAAQEGQPIAVADVAHDYRVHNDSRLNEQAYRSILCVPIILFARHNADFAGDRLQGVISVQTVSTRSWHEEEIHFLEVVAGELAFFISNAQRYQETDERLHQKIRELTTLQQVSSAIATTLDLQTVLNLIVDQAVVLSRVDRADIFQSGDELDSLQLLASCGGQWDERLRRVIMRTVTEGHPLAVVNAYDDVRFPELAAVAYSENYHSLFCIPLRIGARIMGVIALYTRQQRYFDYEQVQLLSTFADEAAIAIENARLYREAQRSLKIKSTLLQEMHHRVRNNLQTISALLNMQLRRLEPESSGAQVLAQSAGRIQAISAVHNLLCREDIGFTTIQEIAQQVVDGVRMGLVGEKPVHFQVVGTSVTISSREATVVALIINELIDNALSHGLAAEGGLIEVAGWLEDTQVLLEVRDDGPVHPEGPGKSSSGLGLSIIETLVTTDLGGTFTFSRDEQWARARITFPHTQPLLATSEDGLDP